MREKIFDDFMNPKNESRPRIRYWLPEGMTNKSGIINDLRELKKRGYGGVEVVPCKANTSDKRYLWNQELWYQNFEYLLKEAEHLELKVDIANGPQWPIAMPTITNADHEASLYELTYGYKIINNLEEFDYLLPRKRVSHNEGTSKLLAVMAYQLIDEQTLDSSTYLDLMPYVKDNKIEYKFTPCKRPLIIFAFWQQPAVQKVFDKYYVIDHLSRTGVVECEKYWKEKLYPIISKYPNVCESIFCDSLEYDVSMEWTRGFEDIFKDMKGYDLLPYLPLISVKRTYPQNDTPGFQFENKNIGRMINNDYFDVINECYISNHLKPLKELAESMGLSLRYQVAYNKPFNIESCAMEVNIPENESLNRVSINNLTSMNGAVHLGNKKIYSYECNAEFMNAYGQTYEDLLWWVKRAYLAGINRQVIHGAAYNGGFDSFVDSKQNFYEWPGYENFGKYVSNYWNRTLSIKHAKHHIDYISRMNSILQKKHKVDLAIYRHEYLNDGKGADGEYIVNDNALLMNNGYTYDIVSSKLLNIDGLRVENCVLANDGPGYKALIFNEISEITLTILEKIMNFARNGLPIYFVGKIPSQVKFAKELDKKNELNIFIENLLRFDNVKYAESYQILLKLLKQDLIYPNAHYLKETEIGNIHCIDHEINYYYFYNYNRVKCKDNGKKEFIKESYYPAIDKNSCFKRKHLNVEFKHKGIPVILDAETGQMQEIRYYKNDYGTCLSFDMLEDEALIVAFLPEIQYDYVKNNVYKHIGNIGEVVIEDLVWTIDLYKISNRNGLFTDVDYKFYNHYKQSGECTWWDEMDTSLKNFGGYGIYSTKFNFTKEINVQYILELCEISDTFELMINNQRYFKLSRYKQVMDITDLLVNGENTITIKVYSTLANVLIDNANKHYGINGKIKIRRDK